MTAWSDLSARERMEVVEGAMPATHARFWTEMRQGVLVGFFIGWCIVFGLVWS